MQIAVRKTAVSELGILLGAGLGLGLTVWLAAYVLDPVLVSLGILALLAGGLLLLRPEVGIFILLASVFFKYPESMQRLGGIGLENIIRAVLAVVLLGTCAFRRNLSFFRSHQVQLLAMIAVIVSFNWFLIGRIHAPAYLTELDQSTRSLQRAILQFVFVAFLVAFIRTPRQLAAITWFFVFAVALTVLGAVNPTLAALTSTGDGTSGTRAAATFGIQAAENSNRLAFLCLVVIPLIWFRMMESRSRLVPLAGSAGILGLALTVLLSGSRSGLLNLAILPALLVAQSRQKGRQGMVILIVTLLAIGLAPLVVPQPVLDRLATLLPSEGARGDPAESTHRRWLVLWEGLKFFSQSPFLGVGIGNFRWLAITDPSYGVEGSTHNAYLLALVEGGVILLALQLFLFWQTYRDLGKIGKRAVATPQLGLHWLVTATRTNIVLLAVFSLFAEAWKEFYYPLLIGTAAVLAQLHRAPSERS